MSPCFEPHIIRVGFICEEPLVCGPERTLYASFIESIAIYIGLRTCLLLFEMVYKYLMLLLEHNRREFAESLFGTTYFQDGLFWSKEQLVCGSQRTHYPSCIVNNVMYDSLLTCILMFRMYYIYLMVLQQLKRRRLNEPLFRTTYLQRGFYLRRATCLWS